MRLVGALALGAFVTACGSESTPCDTSTTSAFYVATDENSATSIGSLPLDGAPPSSRNVMSKDPALAWSHDRRFVIQRDLDALFESDACGDALLQLSARAAGEAGPVNPQDVAVAPDGSIWIARFGVVGETTAPASIYIPNASPESTTIDLSSFDSDGNPDASSIRILGTNAFVTLERLQNEEPTQDAIMAIIDTSTLKLATNVTLKGRNPFGLMKEENGMLWIAAPGSFSDAAETNAGVEVFDTSAMTSSLVVTEATLGASVVEVAPSSDGTCAAAILADATTANSTSLVSFPVDPTTHAAGGVTTLIAPTGNFDLRGLFWTQNGTLLVADDRPTQSGFPIHVFSNQSCTLTKAPDLALVGLPALAFSN